MESKKLEKKVHSPAGIAVGLKKGHIVTKREEKIRPSRKKNVTFFFFI